MAEPYQPEAGDRAAVRLAEAATRWAAALRAHRLAEPNPQFAAWLQALAQAAVDEQTACQELNAAGLLWRPMPGAERSQPPYELRPGTGRRGPSELWERFDAAILRLNYAVGDSDPLAVAAAFANLARVVAAGADVVELDGAATPGHVEHAYALTGHGAQGATITWAGVIGRPEEFSREWAYTALSRAREQTTLHLIAQRSEH